MCLICDEEFGCLPEIVVGILRAEFRMRNREKDCCGGELNHKKRDSQLRVTTLETRVSQC